MPQVNLGGGIFHVPEEVKAGVDFSNFDPVSHAKTVKAAADRTAAEKKAKRQEAKRVQDELDSEAHRLLVEKVATENANIVLSGKRQRSS